MTSVVVDASIAVGWVHPGQATTQSASLLDVVGAGTTLVAPALWPVEVANAMTVLVRRKKLAAEQREVALRWLRVLPVRIDHEMAGLAFSTLADLATTHQLSVYDAAYLELAQRRQTALACADGPLRSAAKRLGIPLWKAP